MSIYPSLEDMKVDQMAQAQRRYEAATQPAIQPAGAAPQNPGAGAPPQYPPQQVASAPSLYPSLSEYMGLNISPEQMAQMSVQPYNQQNMQVGVRQAPTNMQVAPVTGNNIGLAHSEIKQGIRELILCKDQEGKIGLRVRHVNQGLFVALVQDHSAAALAGLKFGDQILQINGQTVAGWDNDKAHKFFKQCPAQNISIAVRDRPFERTLTMQKDSNGFIGFIFKNGKINSLVKDSSAARNGLLTEHQLIEVHGQNVVGLKDDDIGNVIEAAGRTVTITIMPTFIYEHIVKCMGNSLIRKLMDHSIPDW